MYRIHEHKVTSPIDNILERQGTMYLIEGENVLSLLDDVSNQVTV